MSTPIQRVHDKLFRTVFGDPQEAEGFLRAHLPQELVRRLVWSTLTPVETSFADETLRESESDLLYTVQTEGSEEPLHLYLLFEHQSTPDRWMRFRLLKYMCRIWDESFKEQPAQSELRPIIPLVFYQGASRWSHSTEFAALIAESEREPAYVPRFAHLLVDQSEVGPEAVRGGLKAQVAQLLMMAAYHEPVQKLLAAAAPLLAQVAKSGGTDYVTLFVVYLTATQERRVVQEFAETIRHFEESIGGEMLTYAEELRQEGRLEGRQEGRQEGRVEGLHAGEVVGQLRGQIDTIDNLLRSGVDWVTITAATGIDEKRLAQLRQRLDELTAEFVASRAQQDAANASAGEG